MLRAHEPGVRDCNAGPAEALRPGMAPRDASFALAVCFHGTQRQRTSRKPALSCASLGWKKPCEDPSRSASQGSDGLMSGLHQRAFISKAHRPHGRYNLLDSLDIRRLHSVTAAPFAAVTLRREQQSTVAPVIGACSSMTMQDIARPALLRPCRLLYSRLIGTLELPAPCSPR